MREGEESEGEQVIGGTDRWDRNKGQGENWWSGKGWCEIEKVERWNRGRTGCAVYAGKRVQGYAGHAGAREVWSAARMRGPKEERGGRVKMGCVMDSPLACEVQNADIRQGAQIITHVQQQPAFTWTAVKIHADVQVICR